MRMSNAPSRGCEFCCPDNSESIRPDENGLTRRDEAVFSATAAGHSKATGCHYQTSARRPAGVHFLPTRV